VSGVREGDGEREAAMQRAADLAARLDEMINALSDGVQAVQLPLHILLDSPFGALNENQEEMLEAARAAAEQLEVRLRQSRKLIDVDRGAVPVHVRPIGLAELLRPALAIAEARAAKRGVTLRSSVSPLAPRALVDPMHAQEAVTLALGEALDRAESGSTLHLEAGEEGEGPIRIRIIGGPELPATLPLRLAGALLHAQGGTLVNDRAALSIELPSERTERTNR
jgi:signal transduction histidine kinase